MASDVGHGLGGARLVGRRQDPQRGAVLVHGLDEARGQCPEILAVLLARRMILSSMSVMLRT